MVGRGHAAEVYSGMLTVQQRFGTRQILTGVIYRHVEEDSCGHQKVARVALSGRTARSVRRFDQRVHIAEYSRSPEHSHIHRPER